MQVVHSSKNKFLREIFQVETTPPSLGRGTIRHLGSDQVYKVGLLALSCRNNSFLLPSIKLWLFLTSSFFCTVSANLYLFHSNCLCRGAAGKVRVWCSCCKQVQCQPCLPVCIPGHLCSHACRLSQNHESWCLPTCCHQLDVTLWQSSWWVIITDSTVPGVSVPRENKGVKCSGLETVWGTVQVLCPAPTFIYLDFWTFNYVVSPVCEGTFAFTVYIFDFSCQDTEQSACYLTYYLSILLALFSDLALSSSVFVPVRLSAVQNTWPRTGKHPGGKECQKWYKQQQRTVSASLKCYEYLQIKYQVYLHCSNGPCPYR